MSQTVYKFKLFEFGGPTDIELSIPINARTLTVRRMDDKNIYLWVLLNPQDMDEIDVHPKRKFILLQTGTPIFAKSHELSYIGTIFDESNGMVTHVFESIILPEQP